MKVIIAAALAAATTLGFVAAASGADLLIDAPAVSATESTDWSGAYVGASLGLGQGVVTWDYAFPILQSEDDLDGWVGGLQAGYNLQAGSLVFGVEGNIDWTGLATAGAPDTLPRDIDWMGSLRARVGFAADSLLFYGTAGAVVAETTGSTFLDEAVAKRHSGWTAGLGVEAMVSDSLSVKLEYAYSAFDTQRYDYTDPAPFSIDAGFDTSVIKGGVNFHF